MRRVRTLLATVSVAILGAALAAPTDAAERPALNKLAGPVSAEVLRVVDGDTIEVRAHIWLGQEITTLVRLARIDAPELKGKCEGERAAARRAKAAIEEKLAGGDVTLRDITFEKYAGRVMSRVETADGEDLARVLQADGFVRAYGGAKRLPWCATDH